MGVHVNAEIFSIHINITPGSAQKVEVIEWH